MLDPIDRFQRRKEDGVCYEKNIKGVIKIILADQ